MWIGARIYRSSVSRICLIALLSLTAAVAIVHTTSNGPCITPDSARYIDMARNLLAGRGFSDWSRMTPGLIEPERHWPPFYPMVIAPLLALGIDGTTAVRWLGVSFFAATLFLCTFIIVRHTGSLWAGAAGLLVLATNKGLFEAHCFSESEQPFIFCTMIALLALGAYVAHPRSRPLLLAAVAAGLAFLARQAGLALLGVGVVGILFFNKSIPLKRRVINAGIFFILALLPMGLWMTRNAIIWGHSVDRPLAYHTIPLATLRGGLDTFADWIVPGMKSAPSKLAILVVAALVVLGIAVLFQRRRSSPAEPSRRTLLHVSLRILSLYVVAYSAMLFGMICLFDVNLPLDRRLTLPIFVPAAVAVVCAAFFATIGKPLLRIVLAAGCIVLVGLHMAEDRRWILWRLRVGMGYEAGVWRKSPTLAYVRSLPPTAVIYSNEEMAINYFTQRGAARVPEIRSVYTMRPKDQTLLEHEVEEVVKRMSGREGSCIVYFKNVNDKFHCMATPTQLGEMLPLRSIAVFPDGAVYGIKR